MRVRPADEHGAAARDWVLGECAWLARNRTIPWDDEPDGDD
jgi:hypothetical protein